MDLSHPILSNFSIKQWSEEDRPREKLIYRGASSLSDAELLALLIGSGNREESSVQLCQRILLSVSNNLKQLAHLDISDLTQRFKGIGEAKAVTILAALELGKRYGNDRHIVKEVVRTSQEAYALFRPILCDLPYEELWVAFLNRGSKVLMKRKFSQGGTGDAPVDLKLILREALAQLATGIIVCHNHPSGNVLPSLQDDTMTQRLGRAAGLMDVRLLDHIILSEDDYYSYADKGRIAQS